MKQRELNETDASRGKRIWNGLYVNTNTAQCPCNSSGFGLLGLSYLAVEWVSGVPRPEVGL